MMTTQKTAATKPQKKGILNRMLEHFSYRTKFNRSALNIEAADILRVEIQRQGITQKTVADKVGISPARLSQILNTEEKNLTLNTIADIATALDRRIKLSLSVDRCVKTERENRVQVALKDSSWTFDATKEVKRYEDYPHRL